mmetsp:Transcript_7919/g.18297  ORF Transcript_7919/g.18297 Transcript_7919/m.18297 type:complete len:211 (-) Transcript_7919:55-687(-)
MAPTTSQHTTLLPSEDAPSRQPPWASSPRRSHLLLTVAVSALLMSSVSANLSPENAGLAGWIQAQSHRGGGFEEGEVPSVLQQTASVLQQAYAAPPVAYPPQQVAPQQAAPVAAAPQQNGYGALPQQPPLVTYETMDEAKKIEPGIFIDELSHKSQIRSAALARQLHAYRGVSPWFFVFTFLATVGTIIVAFFHVKDIWSKRQEDETGLR